jgi:hypothetical protein
MSKILKNRLERCQWLIDKGYTCDLDAGKVYNPKGVEVGTGVNGNGYKIIGMPRTFDKNQKNQKNLKVHQFIYYYHHKIVVELIDHIDRNRINNSISNLRESTQLENTWNVNSIGVYWDVKAQKWVARIKINKKKYYLGLFEDYDLAVQYYQKAKELRDSFKVDNTITSLEFRNLIKQKMEA